MNVLTLTPGNKVLKKLVVACGNGFREKFDTLTPYFVKN
jgi:hypothetical protein